MSQLSIALHIHSFATHLVSSYKHHGPRHLQLLLQVLRESAQQFLLVVASQLKMLTDIQSLHVSHLAPTILITVLALHLMKSATSLQLTLLDHQRHTAISIQRIMLHLLLSNRKKNHQSSSCALIRTLRSVDSRFQLLPQRVQSQWISSRLISLRLLLVQKPPQLQVLHSLQSQSFS